MKKILHFYPIFFAVIPLLNYFQHNQKEVELRILVHPLVVCILLTAILFIFFKLILKHIAQARITTALFVFVFLSYGQIKSVLYSISIFNTKLLTRDIEVLSLVVFLFFIGMVYIFKKKHESVEKVLIIFSSILLFISLSFIIPFELTRLKTETNITGKVITIDKKIEYKPDIYYIIMDRYANENVLKKYYNYDNSEFINFLKEKGFYIADESFTNYPKTLLSLASSLNIEHITYLTEKYGKKYQSYTPAYKLITNNKVARTLMSQGYKYYYFGDWWEPTRKSEIADKNINLFLNSDEFTRKFFETSALYAIKNEYIKKTFFSYSHDKIYENMQYKFDMLKTIASENSPKFVFVHMLMPHYPYIFDKDCNQKKDIEGVNEQEQYIDQLTCTNKLLITTIAGILNSYKRPPVIILQSDEGPFYFKEMRRSGEGVKWTDVSDKSIEIHMKILNAYLMPEATATSFYPSLSPVNTFRILFNTYFKTNFKLLEDTSYFIPHLNYPYDFYEVTNILKNTNNNSAN